MAEYLPVQLEAKRFHGEGLAFELNADFVLAQETLQYAWNIANEQGTPGAAKEVQLAHIEGDMVFNRVRSILRDAPKDQKDQLLETTHHEMIEVAESTLPYLSAVRKVHPAGELQDFKSKRMRREVFSRHASASSMSSRILLSRINR